jgi:hypothetical protein
MPWHIYTNQNGQEIHVDLPDGFEEYGEAREQLQRWLDDGFEAWLEEE